jgi:hypothetical protein
MPGLQIPSALYGTQKEVATRAKGMVKRVAKGEPLASVVGSELLDPTGVSGLVLTRRSRVLSQVPAVHAYAPLDQIGIGVFEGRYPGDLMDRIFRDALALPWGVLSLISHDNNRWFFPEPRHLPFGEKAIEWWPLLDGIGPRYTFGTTPGERLWSVPNNLHYVAGHLGVPLDDLKKPLPPGGLAALDALRVSRPNGAN